MTVKKRLFISNILMIVIPAFVSVIVSLCAILILWHLFYQPSVNEISEEISYIYSGEIRGAEKIIKAGNKADPKQTKTYASLEKYLTESNKRLEVYTDKGELIYSLGVVNKGENSAFAENLRDVETEGSISYDGNSVYCKRTNIENKEYLICVYSNSEYKGSNNYEGVAKSIVLGIIVLVVVSVFVTNGFLTKFVFKKIKKPIDILTEGVNNIKGGNLEIHIDYNEKDEFKPVCEAFNDMTKRLKESLDYKQKQEENRKELIAGISHDLRTPLTSIKAYIEGLIDGVAATPQLRMKYMKTIKEKADDIDRITDKLFLFSKLDLGDYPFYPETINVKNEICNIADDTKYSESNVNINIKQNDEIVEIYADPVQFRNAVTNILENSLKYKDKDVVNINIGYENTEKYVRIIIDDDGPGVPEEALEKLFNVFYRSDPSRNNPNKGSGLGLAITAKILEHFGGNIYAENIKPKGLRVVMEFPKEGVESGKSSDN